MKSLPSGRIAVLVACVALGAARAFATPDPAEPVFATAELLPMQPMGEAKGIFPGRVVWVFEPTAVNQNTVVNASGHGWFLRENNNQTAIDGMVATALHNLTGQNSDSGAWEAIFRYHNTTRGKGAVGYVRGEKVFIKINATSAWTGNFTTTDLTPNAYISETSMGPVLAVLRQLVNVVGVNQADIYVGDPLKHVYKHLYDVWHGEFPNVHFLGNGGFSHLGRESVVASPTAVIHYSDRGATLRTNVWSNNYPGDNPVFQDNLYSIFQEAEYLINIPMLKGHKRAGVTMFAKNHFGSHTRGDASHLHNGLIAPTEMPNVSRGGYGLYRIQVDIMGHALLGKKNLIFLLDALWATDAELGLPLKWQMAPFANRYMASVFASLDPVAIESVGYDFLRTEFTATRSPAAGTYVQMPGVDDYLHQAADSANWASGIAYDPDNTGTFLSSLGTHEHWNNAASKQYSRNLAPTGTGIELIPADQNIRTELLAGQSIVVGGTARFSVLAIGPTPLSYRWQRQAAGSATWSDLNESAPYAGVATATLTVSGATVAMNGDHFHCVVNNGVNPAATSNSAALEVTTIPTLLVPPASASLGTGARLVFSVLATDPTGLSYQWRKNGTDLAGATTATFALSSVTAADAGSYTVLVRNALGGAIITAPATLAVSAQAYTPPAATLINISARAQVGTDTNVLIAGFVVGGSGSKKVLIRAVGPKLGFYGVPGVLADPRLELTTLQGTPLAANDDWGSSDAAAIAAAGSASGAFALDAGSKDAALIVTLPAGSYTATAKGVSDTTGIALVELYDLDRPAASRLLNISARARVGTGAQALIAGFTVVGSVPRNVLARAIGPTLGNYGVAGALPDPQLSLQLLGGPVVAVNDNWDATNGAAIATAAQLTGAFALTAGTRDAALLGALAEGQYTPVVTDRTGQAGVALVEVYEAP